jgi:8-oxo-dGTP pyrophosphatase MutT (NUDIX family)
MQKILKGMEYIEMTSTRPRAAAAVFRNHNQEILLVKHRWRDGSTSWILPGGALLPQEKPEEAALRELEEETGLKGKLIRFLFTLPYELGTSAIFLVEVDDQAQISLGYDPEEVEEEHKMLVDVAWFSLETISDHPEVQRVLSCLHWTSSDHHKTDERP